MANICGMFHQHLSIDTRCNSQKEPEIIKFNNILEDELAEDKVQLSTFDVENKKIQIYGDINPRIAKDLSSFLDEVNRSAMAVIGYQNNVLDKSSNEIIIEIFSSGGCSLSALTIYNLLRSKTPQGLTIRTVGNGLVSSAATIIFAAGDIRQSYKNTRFLIHETSLSQISGKSSEIEDNANLMKSIEEDFLQIYKNCCANTKNAAKFAKDIQAHKSKDWIFDGEAALSYGFVTELIPYTR